MKNFKLIVRDQQNNILHEPEFDSLEEMQAHKDLILERNDWNFPTKKILVPAWQETIPATDTEPEHIVFHPETTKQVYNVVFEELDNTAANEAEKTKKEKKKKDRGDRVTSLKTIDWAKINTIAELKTIVKALVDDNLKDDN